MQDIEKYKALILPVLNRYFIKRAAIFGSVAKGNASTTSDIDILVEGSNDFTFFKLLALEQDLSTAVNRRVDLVEYAAIKPSIKQEVLNSAVAIL